MVVLIIFLVILQTDINVIMLSIGEQGGNSKWKWIKSNSQNRSDQMSLNSNSTQLHCSELNQTHQENELTHKLILFFG